jgi:hypothetical protein
MGSHDPFEYLKHKLWPKEGLGVKLAIWLLTTKNGELPWFNCMQVACHILLKKSWGQIQLCFTPHFNWRSIQNVMGFQSRKGPNFESFKTPHLGVPRQNDIWAMAPWLGIENTIRRKVVASPKSGLWWVLWVCVCPWLVCAPKVL